MNGTQFSLDTKETGGWDKAYCADSEEIEVDVLGDNVENTLVLFDSGYDLPNICYVSFRFNN
ncbi:MAG: hypothetical protein AAGI88_16065 [Pseudomonadota bacterium]